MSYSLRYLALIALVLLVAACSVLPSTAPATSPGPFDAGPTAAVSSRPTATTGLTTALEGPVVEVVDGDTVKVRLGARVETVRVVGIDTPETVAPDRPVQCYGREATARAKQLLTGKNVRLAPDPTQDARDKYDRMLAYVTVGGEDFGLAMIAGGFAHEYTYDRPYQRQALYVAAENEARAKGLGLWASSTCRGDTTQPASGVLPTTPTATKTISARVDSGVAPSSRTECPASHPIKGNVRADGDNIYHVAGQSSGYNSTVPEVCFASVADAEAAGFRAPHN